MNAHWDNWQNSFFFPPLLFFFYCFFFLLIFFGCGAGTLQKIHYSCMYSRIGFPLQNRLFSQPLAGWPVTEANSRAAAPAAHWRWAVYYFLMFTLPRSRVLIRRSRYFIRGDEALYILSFSLLLGQGPQKRRWPIISHRTVFSGFHFPFSSKRSILDLSSLISARQAL